MEIEHPEYSIYFKRSSADHPPIAEFKVAEGEGICLDYSKRIHIFIIKIIPIFLY